MPSVSFSMYQRQAPVPTGTVAVGNGEAVLDALVDAARLTETLSEAVTDGLVESVLKEDAVALGEAEAEAAPLGEGEDESVSDGERDDDGVPDVVGDGDGDDAQAL